MLDSRSRYSSLEIKKLTSQNGETVPYITRRFLPKANTYKKVSKIVTKVGDRLDLISVDSLGDALFYWQICDANNAMCPNELIEQPGSVVSIPAPRVTK
jgi:hypothetical protein